MIESYIEKLQQGQILNEKEIKTVCNKVKEIMIEEPNCTLITAPVTVCGDIHGQYYDMLELFNSSGDISTTKYLFLGDYVDRGFMSVETIELLLCYKLKYPGNITLLRGNHESRQISMSYGLYEEILKKYGNTNVWSYLNQVFDHMPISASIEGKVFCCHGGLSPVISYIDQISNINRITEIPHFGAFCDLMWSDPDNSETNWIVSNRGAGYIFNSKVVDEFNHLNNIDLICRAHQLVSEGFQYMFNNKLITVWSAPNYGFKRNKASYLKFDRNLNRTIEIFDASSKNEYVKNYRNALPYFL